MPVTSGTRLGPYEIVSPIGAGGMGEVYRARDTKLHRDVAIKVLPEEFASDPERLARFEREAKLLASLNHPNIASIHGFEESDGVSALVLELVEGPTLAERIAEGPIPVDEALAIARQIAEALEAGHETGVIHRDLKPANVKIKEDGTVKVLDYGLAKAFAGETPGGADSELSQSPTLTRQTQVGVILGTAAYMSPEQAKGKRVDRRTDVFAFGAVFYEMLTGRRAFAGEDVGEVLAAVIKSAPDWALLPRDTAPEVPVMLRRCLEKDPARRWRDVGDAIVFLEDASSLRRVVSGTSRTSWSWARATLFTLLGMCLATVAVIALRGVREQTRPAVKNLTISLASDVGLHANPRSGPSVALSPDGETLVFVGGGLGDSSLYVRSLDSSRVEPLPGTDGAFQPFFSPDNEWLGFFAGNQLKKLSLATGRTAVVGEFDGRCSPSGAVWLESGQIIFAAGCPTSATLQRIPASGGSTTLVDVKSDDTEITHAWPIFAPDPGFVLAAAIDINDGSQVVLVDIGTGESKALLENARALAYVASGHVLFARPGTSTVFAAPFDVRQTRIDAERAVPILDDVERSSFGSHQLSLSQNGTLVYLPVGFSQIKEELTWVSRNGDARTISLEGLSFTRPSLSPDGRRVAVAGKSRPGGPPSVMVVNWERETLTRLTSLADEVASGPIWLPDGERIVFASDREKSNHFKMYSMPWDGSESAIPVLGSHDDGAYRAPLSASRDGATLVFRQPGANGNWDIGFVELDGSQPPELVLDSEYDEIQAELSPDGAWLAYASDQSGRYEVFVQPFPSMDRKWKVSTEGGREPRWSRVRPELYYRDGNRMMVVPYTTSPSFKPQRVTVLFETEHALGARQSTNYDVTPDGESFIMVFVTGADASRSELRILLNWTEELKRLVPTE